MDYPYLSEYELEKIKDEAMDKAKEQANGKTSYITGIVLAVITIIFGIVAGILGIIGMGMWSIGIFYIVRGIAILIFRKKIVAEEIEYAKYKYEEEQEKKAKMHTVFKNNSIVIEFANSCAESFIKSIKSLDRPNYHSYVHTEGKFNVSSCVVDFEYGDRARETLDLIERRLEKLSDNALRVAMAKALAELLCETCQVNYPIDETGTKGNFSFDGIIRQDREYEYECTSNVYYRADNGNFEEARSWSDTAEADEAPAEEKPRMAGSGKII